MRKPAFRICENKGADQLRSNCAADQRLCFRYTDSTVPLFVKSGFSGCTSRFVFDLVGDPKDRFCRDVAHMVQFI